MGGWGESRDKVSIQKREASNVGVDAIDRRYGIDGARGSALGRSCCTVSGKRCIVNLPQAKLHLRSRVPKKENETHILVTTPACLVSLMGSVRYPFPAFTRLLQTSHE